MLKSIRDRLGLSFSERNASGAPSTPTLRLEITSVRNATLSCVDDTVIVQSSTGDPQCEVRLSDRSRISALRAGEYTLTAVLSGNVVEPVLYVDFGNGFSEEPSSRLPLVSLQENRYTTSFRIVRRAPLRKIRLDPSTTPGKYVIASLELRAMRDAERPSAIQANEPTSNQSSELPGFDPSYYLRTYPDIRASGVEPVQHYLFTGHFEGRNPSATFRTSYYRSRYLTPGTNENPLLHYNRVGRALGYLTQPMESDVGIANEFARNVRPSELFEPVDPKIFRSYSRNADVFAFYLPQFHQIPENDRWWGKGFTEWTNVMRGLPRYRGHYQPRIPADLGFYDLSDPRVMVRQARLAKSMGISGFIFYYYRFDQGRLLQEPIEAALKNPSFDMPFALMWANENWTRTWDGGSAEVLIEQNYKYDDDDALVADLARHMIDRRYLTFEGRPLFIIYRPSLIPDARNRIDQWRRLFRTNHHLEPLIFMAQFDSIDPRQYDLDGAIEFPPHKIARNLPSIDRGIVLYDEAFERRVYSYSDAVDAALAEPDPEFDLIKTVFPMWDNDARRQRFSTSFVGSTPKEYERWLLGAIDYARRRPVRSKSIVCVNAWNEWAEGAYLEPDVHFGGAYLNATARAVTFASRDKAAVLLVGHDAHDHGAQRLLLNIAASMHRKFGVRIEIAVLGPGRLVSAYKEIAPTTVCSDEDAFRTLVKRKCTEGFGAVICNTTPGGRYVKILKDHHLKVISLIHELPTLLRDYGLHATSTAICTYADVCLFPSELVKSKFETFTGLAPRLSEVRPQGLYDDISADPGARDDVRRELGIPFDARIVVNIAFGDLRKGLDLFIRAAQRFHALDPNVYFVWVGTIQRELEVWMIEHASKIGGTSNFLSIGFREDLGRILSASDVFLLTSREDPFPSALIDALAAGLPVVAMEGSGGFIELFDFDFVGQLAPFGDIDGLCEKVRGYLELPPDIRDNQAQLRRQLIERNFDFNRYVFKLLRLAGLVDHSVSVIVPNYNYAGYLRQRLSGIFNQSYPVYEIIVLDDASTDESVVALDKVVSEFGRDVIRVVNTANSGSGFRQWRKGVELARGDLVWIAEADDDAGPNFLAHLVRLFREGTNVIFAFSESATIDEQGKKLSNDYQYYYSSFGKNGLANELIMDSKDFAIEHLSIRNHVLSASSVIWKRDRLKTALDRAGSALFEFRVAGDWRLYLEACLMDGQIGFTPDPLSIHRRHANSVTGSTNLLDQVREIKKIHDFSLDRYPSAKKLAKSMMAYRQELTERAGRQAESIKPKELTPRPIALSKRR